MHERTGRLWRLVESPLFTALVLAVILANAVVLGNGAVAPAPVLERIAILRAALEELEEELAQIPVK